ncbi:hypothetical protein ACQP1V_43460 (plasmid) [Microtetraspora malaysiensis]|uniref:hypothetical protein n=1 Tax=Microtetraspora malaysiensis TaxID=161358 RepID=UPI003D92293E
MDTFNVLVTAFSNRDLKKEEFENQVAALRPLMTWNPSTTAWHVQLRGERPEHAGNALTALFEVARMYGTTVTVRLVPTEPAGGAVAAD